MAFRPPHVCADNCRGWLSRQATQSADDAALDDELAESPEEEDESAEDADDELDAVLEPDLPLSVL